MARGEKMYRNSPKMERDSETGNMKVTKPKTSDPELNDADNGIPIHARHAIERSSMSSRHEMEHAMSDYGSGDKSEMMDRHLSEIKDMQKRHMKEIGKGDKTETKTEKKAEKPADTDKDGE